MSSRGSAKRGTQRSNSRQRAGVPTGRSAKASSISQAVMRRSAGLTAAGGVKVDVYARCRPLNRRELAAGDQVVLHVDTAENGVTYTGKSISGPNSAAEGERLFFDGTFAAESSQQEVFDEAVLPIIDQVMTGMNCAIFAYGQTGTGKTHTMLGDLLHPDNAGIIPRSIQAIFSALHATYAQSTVHISFLEIYNEQLEDLFEGIHVSKGLTLTKSEIRGGPGHSAANGRVASRTQSTMGRAGSNSRSRPSADGSSNLRLMDDPRRGTVCYGLTEIEVETTEEILELLRQADEHSQVAATKMNERSNRSHRVFTLTAEFQKTSQSSPQLGVLTLVDLAGSESVGRSGARDERAKEAGNINKSLLTFSRVIKALAKNEPHIPYRDSKLTRLVSEALGGACKTSIIATFAPGVTSIEETMSTLRYAQGAMKALNVAQMPRSRQLEMALEELNAQYEDLVATSSAQISGLEETVKELKSENKQLSDRNIELEVNLNNTKAERDALLVERKQLQDRVSTLESHLQAVIDHSIDYRARLKECKKDRDVLYMEKLVLLADRAQAKQEARRIMEHQQLALSGILSDVSKLESAVSADVGGLQSNMGKYMDTVHSSSSQLRRTLESQQQQLDNQVDAHQRSLQELNTHTAKMVDDVAKALRTSQQGVNAGLRQHQTRLKEFQRAETNRGQEEVSLLLRKLKEKLAANLADSKRRTEQLVESNQTQTQEIMTSVDKSVTDTANALTSQQQDVDRHITKGTERIATAQTALTASHNSCNEATKALGSALESRFSDAVQLLHAQLNDYCEHVKTVSAIVTETGEAFGGRAPRLTARNTATFADEDGPDVAVTAP